MKFNATIPADRGAVRSAMERAYRIACAIVAAGDCVDVLVRKHEDDRSLKQNAYYWGFVLKHVSEQGRIDGARYSREAWHELFRRLVLSYQVTKIAVAGRKKKMILRKLRSTTDLTVHAFTRFLEEVIAMSATEFGVAFPPDRWEDWRAPE
jgi:hypothetical protein